MISKIKPVIVLTVICTLVCALLIVTYNLTYTDTSGVITEDLYNACVKLDGEASFALVTDRAAAGLDGGEFENIKKIVKNTDKNTFLFEVVTDGYAADGIDVVVGMTADGKVSGVAVVALGETPGLGTKINDDAFLQKFAGISSEVAISKNPPVNENEIQAVTGSTYSSKGLASAVNYAVAAYAKLNREVQA